MQVLFANIEKKVYFCSSFELIAMKKVFFCILFFLVCTLTPCAQPIAVKGADVSWVTEQEADGVAFRNAAGDTTDLFVIMREEGVNAIRLRVFVDPVASGYGPWCDLQDAIVKARRAQAQGMEVMIDFHYSDFFADPGCQRIPASWQDTSLQALAGQVSRYTRESMERLCAAGITPRWVQVGNETTSGMLLPTGRIQWEDQPGHRFDRYVTLSNAGYEAVKAVCPKTEVVIHIDNAFQAWEGDCCWFREYIEAGGKVDVIGLSHYATPEYWNRDSVHVPSNINAAKSVEALHRKFGKPVMLVETGFPTDDPELWRTAMSDLYTRLQAGKSCAGVFYWEPQVFRWWRPGYYIRNNWGAYNMGAFTWYGQPMKGFLPE